eukprot:COSAG02_NODE_796_length_17128_cov_176.587586_17_plen_88_part_00
MKNMRVGCGCTPYPYPDLVGEFDPALELDDSGSEQKINIPRYGRRPAGPRARQRSAGRGEQIEKIRRMIERSETRWHPSDSSQFARL